MVRANFVGNDGINPRIPGTTMIPTLIFSQNYVSSVKVRQSYLVTEDEQKEKGHAKSKTSENKVLSLSWKVMEDTTSCPVDPRVHPHTLWKDVAGIGRLVVGNR